ncbi:pyridoxamine 5'-phosphate oxidase family protein [Bacillus pseudomycoides]|uniref:pyridoxamine 5'-phosphate oxidase family protein n=1 Tax=Bacillus pseudomycoides TaxID=64104 RepID=UPI000BEE5677|nr:pyridoxamine 5'-phosphate oxidase family protein [Bacillus pseudomycoides]PEF23703.1 phosphohydrolase [Bacillus pseudomycoides]PGD73748.1 phosphohydrolase [Bacillus pseudomycoides]PGF09195.1 phosphohydrolase [Bacillus pseudomycoides]
MGLGEKKINSLISTEEELRLILGYPSERAVKKVIPSLDYHCREFLSKSPFLVISTSDEFGHCDASPRGDAPGFVYVLNENQIVIPERPGNRRVDSILNILSNSRVGLIFFIPGLGESLRINGRATITKDEEILEKMQVRGRNPLLGIVVKIEECFIHCAKAFIRSELWNPDSWLEKEALPSAAKMLADHAEVNANEEEVARSLEESYTKRLY